MSRTLHPGRPDPDVPARVHLDMTTLRLFIATAELGGVTRAAEREHLAPAAASRRIQEFEAQFGLPLFRRLPHGMALTDAGRTMLAHARNLTHTVVRMQDDAAAYRHGEKGVVRLAAPKSAVIQFMPLDIQRCGIACPDVRIDLQEMNSQIVQQSLARGVVDLGIYEASLGSIDLPALPYRSDRLVVVVARGHPLATRRKAGIDDILSWDVIGLSEGSAVSIAIERQAAEAGRILRMPMRVGGFDSMAALIAQGLGIGVMPQAVARAIAGGPRFARVAIEGEWAVRRFVLCHRPMPMLSLAAQSVLQVLADTQNANPESPD
ncbi:LysR family transcriptional regulator [Variovorax sp. J22R133]|uniref:LysR family transcriptional regulator n=1 Tax=Variovorax brevis TaxID=3053503 RepID=UPI0025754649|nr:LysR family transcriptional regulator [Variovorax sp. J22R133]MDM0117876.1 LysR family transcriptional regulator [Variovorax sp. J22R133]